MRLEPASPKAERRRKGGRAGGAAPPQTLSVEFATTAQAAVCRALHVSTGTGEKLALRKGLVGLRVRRKDVSPASGRTARATLCRARGSEATQRTEGAKGHVLSREAVCSRASRIWPPTGRAAAASVSILPHHPPPSPPAAPWISPHGLPQQSATRRVPKAMTLCIDGPPQSLAVSRR